MMKHLLKISAILISIWFTGFLIFAAHINAYPQENGKHTDAIIALTGGRNRIAAAVKLLNEKKADKLFISGVEKNSSLKDILAQNDIAAEAENKITLGTSAQNTVENAVESRNWIKSNHIQSIRLVTSNYHIPRSVVEFKTQNPKLEIILHPVYSERVSPQWWTSRRTFFLILSEYNKFLYVYLRTALYREKN